MYSASGDTPSSLEDINRVDGCAEVHIIMGNYVFKNSRSKPVA